MRNAVLKRLVVSMLLSSALWIACAAYASADGAVPQTNVDGVSIYPYEKGKEAEFYIQYGESGKESIGKDFVGLFINGSMIRNANVVTEKNRTLLPVRIVAERLGAQLKWDSKARKVTIADGGQTIELFMGSTHARVNGEYIDLGTAPKMLHDRIYVPLRFVAEALRAKVDYFNGKNLSQPHQVPRLRSGTTQSSTKRPFLRDGNANQYAGNRKSKRYGRGWRFADVFQRQRSEAWDGDG